MANVKLLPAIGLLLAGVGGCGDGPICQSEILLLIQTPQSVVLDARPSLCITHAPGHMLVTDLQNASLADH